MMKKLIPLLFIVVILVSCKKENDNIIWERSLGQGRAYFVTATADSGILSCGVLTARPYLVKFNRNKSIETSYSSDNEGLFSAAWSDTACFITAGSEGGKMLLSRISMTGNKVWDTTLTASFHLDITSLIDEGGGKFLAVGSASPDSSANGLTTLLFVRFDTAGQITKKLEITSLGFLASRNAVEDHLGNIYLGLTKRADNQKSKAAVAKYNNDVQKLWETDLYNNTDFTAESNDVTADTEGNVYVTGKTEASKMTGTLDNSFLAKIDRTGETVWKKYLENANSGTAIVLLGSEGLAMLNRNCFIIRKAASADGSDEGTIRMFNACDSYTTDAFGSDLSLSHDGNYLTAGSSGGNFYVAVKSSQ